MRVEVIRSGGVAGIPRRGRVEFRVRGAREPADAEWATLYRQARSERGRLPETPGAAAAPHVRDAFQWSLRFGRERFEVPDATLRGALRQLAEKVLAEGQ
ncbi:protealysin inhibitor emfourin [Sinomonas soli]